MGSMAPNSRTLRTLKEKGMVTGMEIDSSSIPTEKCEACVQAKQHVQPFPKMAQREFVEIGEMTYMDIWGPARTRAVGGH